MLFLLSSPVQGHGSSVRSSVLHIHHICFLYVLDRLWHLLLLLKKCKYSALKFSITGKLNSLASIDNISQFKLQPNSPSSSYLPVQLP